MAVPQTANNSATGVLTLSTSFSSTPTVGNLAVVMMRLNNGFEAWISSLTVADNQGNTYTSRAARGGYANDTRIYTAPINTASGTFTVTITYEVGGNTWASGFIGMAIAEVSGANTSDPVDEAGNATGTGTTWSLSLAPMSADTTVFTVCGNTWEVTASAAGWTTIVAGTDTAWGAFYRVGDYDPSGTWNASENWSCAGLGVNASGGSSIAAVMASYRFRRN